MLQLHYLPLSQHYTFANRCIDGFVCDLLNDLVDLKRPIRHFDAQAKGNNRWLDRYIKICPLVLVLLTLHL